MNNIWKSINMLQLVDRGHLRYEDKIADHWPEFGANGKAELTVADLMRHEAGLAQLNVPIRKEQLLREEIKSNQVGAVIEREAPDFVGNYRREYHGITRDGFLKIS